MRFTKLIPALMAALILPLTASPAIAADEKPVDFNTVVEVDDEVGFFEDDAYLVEELTPLQGKDGMNWFVTVPKESDTDATKLAENILKEGKDLEGSTVSIVIIPESNAIGVSYSENLRNAIPMEALSNSLDKDLMPRFEKGEYAEGVIAMASSLNMMVIAEGYTGGTSSFGEWAKQNSSSFLVAIIAFIVFLTALIIIPSMRARSRVKEELENVQAQLKQRQKDVKDFWDGVPASTKEDFVKAPNREAREEVIEKVFTRQSFMDTVPHLTNVVGSFFYPGKIAEGFSVQHFIDAENQQVVAAQETRDAWESLNEDQQIAFREAGSERAQNELLTKYFPEEEEISVLAARFTVFIPEAKHTDPNFMTLMDEKLAEDLAKNPPSKPKKRGLL